MPTEDNSLVEVIPYKSTSYKVGVKEARGIVAGGGGRWKGRMRIELFPDRQKAFSGELWCVKQSGKYGPLTLQIVT